MTANSASINDPVKSSGTRNSRSLATEVSKIARLTARTPSLMTSAKSPAATAPGCEVAAMPHGTKMFPSSVRNRKSLMADAHSMSARYRPEYSRIIASWIIVSSRCVDGLSTGNRPVSASATIKNEKNARRCPGLSSNSGSETDRLIISPRPVLPARNAIAKIAIITVGSASAATAISLLDPMPPNELPASRPASARKKVARRNRYIRRMMFPANGNAPAVVSTGTMSAARSIDPITTYGVSRKIHDVFSEITTSLIRSLRRSR